ncbi:MAG: hypothetical protein ACTHJQ_25510 [Rhizobiaceae bacterium]
MALFDPPKINPPKRQEDYPDRMIDCEAALEPVFQDLMSVAFAHGWAPGESMRALRRLIAARKRADEENAKLEADLAILRAMARARS